MTTHTGNVILRYDPILAKVLRLLNAPFPGECAVFLRQMEHWLNTNSGFFSHDGSKHWIYNGYKEWIRKQLTSLSESQFGRMVRWLVKTGILEKTIFAHIKHDLDEAPPASWQESNTRTWLTFCVERTEELTGWRPEFPLPCDDNQQPPTPEDLEDEPVEEKFTVEEAPVAQESLKPLPGAVLQNVSSGSSDLNTPFFNPEEPSLYKENLKQPTNDGDGVPIKEDLVNSSGDGFDPTESSSNAPVIPQENSQKITKPHNTSSEDKNSAPPRQAEVRPTTHKGWHCPNSALRREFMTWLMETMPPIQSSAHASNWCNKHPEDAELRWDDFTRFKNRKNVQQAGFASWNPGQHSMFVKQYHTARNSGGIFLEMFNEKHGAWLEWVQTNHPDWLSNVVT